MDDRDQPLSGLTETLDRLSAATVVRLGGTLDEPVDVGALLSPFAEVVERIRARLERPDREIPQASLAAAREAWNLRGPDLSALGDRNVRILCADDQTATTREFVGALTASGQLERKRRWLGALIGSYFHAWRRIEDPERLEHLLRTSVGNVLTHSRRFQNLKKNARAVFSAEASRKLGEYVARNRTSVDAAIQLVGASRTGGLGREIAGEALKAGVDRFLHDCATTSDAQVCVEFEYVHRELLSNEQVNRDALGVAIDRLVLWTRTGQLDTYRQALEDAIISHPRLGDPRLLANRSNWDTCARARDAVIRWMSRRDLAFFFDFVMDQTEDPHGRKKFWSRYIDQVVDCTVALSPFDAYRLQVQVRERIAHANVTSTRDVSAFLMRFPGTDLIVVEFSRPGNALYIHDGRRFLERVPNGIRALSFDLRDDLKGSSMEETFVHHQMPPWTIEVADFLRRHGIRPRTA